MTILFIYIYIVDAIKSSHAMAAYIYLIITTKTVDHRIYCSVIPVLMHAVPRTPFNNRKLLIPLILVNPSYILVSVRTTRRTIPRFNLFGWAHEWYKQHSFSHYNQFHDEFSEKTLSMTDPASILLR